MKSTQRAFVGLAGMGATMLLHSLLFAIAVWGSGNSLLNPKFPDAVGAGANTGSPEGEIGERRITIMLTPELQEAATPGPVPLLPEFKAPTMLEIAAATALPLPPIIDLPGEEADALDAQLMARAKYAGVYESQVRARIERAWELNLMSTPEGEFSCLVEILQQRDGRVREVVLVRCDDSPQLQQSLVDAIQASSPLPAPPHPSAFVDRFSLEFDSTTTRRQSRTAGR